MYFAAESAATHLAAAAVFSCPATFARIRLIVSTVLSSHSGDHWPDQRNSFVDSATQFRTDGQMVSLRTRLPQRRHPKSRFANLLIANNESVISVNRHRELY